MYMPKILLETEHEGTKEGCEQAVRTFLKTGSHFLTNADWGCTDGEHKAWIIIDAESKDEALMIVPHQYRNATKVVELEKFSLDTVDEIFGPHHI